MANQHTDYPFQPVPFTDVVIEGGFWLPRLETNRTVTIPYDFKKCEETGRIDNFIKAAGKMEGPFTGYWFNDSDVFKVIEGAAYALHVHPDAELEAYIDKVITIIGEAQEADGYLYTPRTIDPAHPHEHAGPERWSNLYMSHELYNLGHMFEAATAYYRATGKRTFLEICLRSADLICSVFGVNAKRDVPGHQEVELGLVKLYRVTGEQKYLDLAKFFLDERGHANGRTLQQAADNIGYMQDHLPVIEQREAVGHSVRAMYMYSGMADVAALTGDEAYITALGHIWSNVVEKKLALTGGVGSRHHGEAFGDNYELPNLNAYNETCAAIGSIFWNHRLFLLSGESKYIDIVERTLYNGFLSGVSLDGTEFFYVNPLACDAQYGFNFGVTLTRQPWFDCSCCPTNVVRLLPALPEYIYAQRADQVYINLYINSTTTLNINNTRVEIEQQSLYPWDGGIAVNVNPAEAAHFTLMLRVPGWAMGKPLPTGDLYHYVDDSPAAVTLTLNGEAVAVQPAAGYIVMERTWQPGDKLALHMDMPVRRVVAHPLVADCAGKVALERGPLVYAVEGVDHGGSVAHLTLPDAADLTPELRPDLLGNVVVLVNSSITAIPYYAWAHRGISEMAVWLAREDRLEGAPVS
ncbi:MAG: glycoside hydrolase family 127 protein [Anaerolineae bacterium]